MKLNFITIVFSFFSLFAIAQTDAVLSFDIEFEVSLEEKTCYDHYIQYTTQDFDLTFYLIYSWPIQGRIEKIAQNKFRMTGEFTFLVGGGGINFIPVLVCMAKPKFKMQSEKCSNSITTFFINLQTLHTKELARNGDYVLTEHIGTINLGDKPFITATKINNKIHYKYDIFFPDFLRNDGIGSWLKL